MGESAEFVDFGLGVSIIVISKRYLYAFGGRNRNCVPDRELIRTLDHLRPQSGWKVLSLDRPMKPSGTFYGVLKLDDSILVFGGQNKDNKSMDDCVLFSSSSL